MNSRLEIAQERLGRALARVDTVLARKMEPDNAAQERETLMAENARLRERQAAIGERLDRAIERLQAILK
jgi:FtsZ-binding cell division protein ZapB